MPISLVLDIIISVLLVLTIAYAVRLNQRLVQLRSDKNELLELAKTFAAATVRAEAAIANLKVSSEVLGTEVTKAETLKEDLAYLVSRGGRTADEMVNSVAGKEPDKAQTRGQPVPQMDTETQLIEDAIRAATPAPGEMADPVSDAPKNQRANTRRITGLLGAQKDRKIAAFEAARTAPKPAEQRSLSSRDLHSGFDDEEGSIGDTDAARELLKALGSVK